ncbi:MAG: transposase [Burkholderiaceae bacterium]|nr:transposase [Burkholderiaceae bacterium]
MLVGTDSDREASFEPILVPKHQRRLAGLDEKIIGLYACGMSEREISRQIEDRLQRRDQRQPHQRGHRRGDGRGHQLAGQAARARLPDRVPRRAGHQGAD